MSTHEIRITEESVYRTLSSSGARCINGACTNGSSRGFSYSLTNVTGELPREKVTCNVCGVSWTATLCYREIENISGPATNPNLDLGGLKLSRYAIGGRDFMILVDRFLNYIETLRSPDASRNPLEHARDKATALARIMRSIPQHLLEKSHDKGH